MYHVLRWNRLGPDEQRIADAAEQAIRLASGGTDRSAMGRSALDWAAMDRALRDLRQLTSYRVMTGGQMRGIRAAMGWLGMGERPNHAEPEAYALPQPSPQPSPQRRSSAGPVPDGGGDRRSVGSGALADDAEQRRHLRQRELALGLDGHGGGIPLRTLTLPGLTWDVTDTSCAAALTRWRTAQRDWRDHSAILYDACGLTTERRRWTWLSWITFLAGAVTHAGLHAEGACHPLNRFGPHTNGRPTHT